MIKLFDEILLTIKETMTPPIALPMNTRDPNAPNYTSLNLYSIDMAVTDAGNDP